MFKKNFVILFSSVVILISALLFSNSVAEDKKEKFSQPPKVAVVNTRYVLQKTKKYAEFVEKMQAEASEISQELKNLSDEIKKGEKALETRVKGSSDYLEMAQGLMEKEASLRARKEFQQNLMTLKEKQWTETMYEKVHQVIAEIAKKEGITLVLDGNPELSREIPAPSPQELVLTIRTRKVLYFADTIDITEMVLAKIDAE